MVGIFLCCFGFLYGRNEALQNQKMKKIETWRIGFNVFEKLPVENCSGSF